MDGLDKAVQTEAFEDKVDAWLDWDKNPETHKEIQSLRDTNGYTALKQLLFIRLKFENSGIRGRMGAGFSQMNDLVVIETTQGLVSYLESVHSSDDVKQRGVAIGFDARHNSKRFAELTATTFLGRGIRVYLFSEICPASFVPLCVSVNKCVAGIVITGSYNPKHYNGYKVYWEKGVQILPPHDENINTLILENLQPWEKAWDTMIIKNNKLCRDPLVQANGMYFKHLRQSVHYPKVNKASKIKVTYTPMHGVGNRFVVEAFKAGNFNPMVAVRDQRDPDPDFPTLEHPDPRDQYSLDMAFRTADATDSTLIIGIAPNCDRLCVAEKVIRQASDDSYYDDDEYDEDIEWRIFTDNDLGALLGWWAFHNHKERNPSADLGGVYMVGSIVSTKFLQAMAQEEGFNYVETSLGFKWIGNKACDLLSQGKTVLFGFDGSLGFMMGTQILDKDGISAGMNVAALAAHLETVNMSLSDKLNELYNKYGHHICINSSFLSKDLTSIANVFERLRSFLGSPDTYPESLDDGNYVVESVRDYATGYDSTTLNDQQETVLRDSNMKNVMTFAFDNGVTLTIRDCGIDPKIKFYTSMVIPPEETENFWMHKDILDEMVGAIVYEFIQPEIHGFKHLDY